MKKIIIPTLAGMVGVVALSLVWYGVSAKPAALVVRDAAQVVLAVPAITQAPGGNWANPWGNACEEASVAMIEAFYTDKKLTQNEANDHMRTMFAWEDQVLGKNEDTSAEEVVAMIEGITSSFRAEVVKNPTLDDIKNELREGRPVIALVNQFEFYRKPPVKQKGFSSHVFVVIGYDDTKRQFIINDPADLTAKRYAYDRLMNSLHDLDASGEATGEAVVVFTQE